MESVGPRRTVKEMEKEVHERENVEIDEWIGGREWTETGLGIKEGCQLKRDRKRESK